jgi:hypothetical protein
LTKIETRNEVSLGIGIENGIPLIDRGRVYLVREKRMEKTIRLLQDFDYSGAATLCVSRTHPDLLRERLPGSKIEAFWLSERSGDNNISPDQLHKILHRINHFLMDTENAVIMFDGIEYLTLFNDFQKVQMFVEEVNDMIMTSESILLMPVDPEALDGRSIARISRYTEII